MAQWIITICILVATLAYALYRIRRYFRRRVMKSQGKPAFCEGCHSDCGSCSMVPGPDPERSENPEKSVDKE